jgi:hypothetical protein
MVGGCIYFIIRYQYSCKQLLLINLIKRKGTGVDEIIENHQCGFRRNRSATDQIFCIHEILERNLEYIETVHQVFINFKKTCDSARKEIVYNIFIEFGVPMKLVRLIKMCINETCSNVHVGRHLSDTFPIQNVLK